ncbi:3-phosphoshikimate 1-carboxyvinyltransferase [Paenibacillus baekrokdamisoli]|uniref:3-phosphoshikimate 1-carboxyvinyltransferase n=2 Tax=Paenibacillus baekrokdamisoli TaxID=1712516 RepID=A0A3G9J1L4_9BACL|nr:3-phosphoshikimate 1-carboxyvinyltransferase [Paenibacillus baekrokdamisoli]MBB3071307.1 3-phosphoshikimate 1-carboxyvinyltransferase [Paenibacillus baekrokdamisoli]BBH24656.1 3-phosphoshikimate 1-carboxyvinyltransferase [Paenibacillus baekrokdamisoli]
MTKKSIVEADLEARSPWSSYKDKQEVILSPPTTAVNASITIPGSKSLTNRALLLAAMAKGTTQIEGLLKGDDSYWCINILKQLGVHVEIQGESATVEGINGEWPNRTGELYVGAAGTVARFLPGLLAAGQGLWRMTGSHRMSERPLAPLLYQLAAMGGVFTYERIEGQLPYTLEAKGLQGGEPVLAGSISSQFISGLLMAAPYAEQTLRLSIDGPIVQREYVEMTLEMMRKFGADSNVEDEGQVITILPNGYQAPSAAIVLEPDVSTCCYFWALAALTNGRIRVEGISLRTLQPDMEMVHVLEKMGCSMVHGENYVEVTGTNQLKGGFTLSMKRWSDQTLTMAVLAIFADGPITFTDAAHIRHHECDRISAICTELIKMGIQVEEHPDGLTVYPGIPQSALLDPHDDHRMAMALSLIGVKVPHIRIANPGCVSKTCPDYYERMEALGLKVSWL